MNGENDRIAIAYFLAHEHLLYLPITHDNLIDSL